MVIVSVCSCAFASGLTIGINSFDITELMIKSRTGTDLEKKYASRILPLMKNHHMLLVSLLLWNALAAEALPIYLDQLVPAAWVAIVVSVTLVLFVGEIIPAAILTGPRGLQLVYFLVPLVYLVEFLFFIVAFPIAKALDLMLGHDDGPQLYNHKELNTLIGLQHELGTTLQADEVNIIGGALKFRDMVVHNVMTPEKNVFMLPSSDRLNHKILAEIFKSGYSRIPVYGKDRNDIVGLLLTKDLIFVDADDETPIANFVRLFGRQPIVVWHDQKLGETLSLFKKGRSHMAIVRDVKDDWTGKDPVYEVVGIVTLEDIIEEIIGETLSSRLSAPPHCSTL